MSRRWCGRVTLAWTSNAIYAIDMNVGDAVGGSISAIVR